VSVFFSGVGLIRMYRGRYREANSLFWALGRQKVKTFFVTDKC